MQTKNVKALITIIFALCAALPLAAQVSINYNFNNNALPPSTSVSGVARVADGYLHLTDAGQAGVNGTFVIPDPSGGRRIGNLHAHWRSYIGDGQSGGADGYSFNWSADGATSGVGEEGTGTGLSVTVDTFDNGGGETGIEIKWGAPDHNSAIGAARTALTFMPKEDPGTGIYLRKRQFVEADLTVDNNTCQATFTYDGQVVTAHLPGYTGITGGSFVLGARTGGANDNQWIDDLTITGGLNEVVNVQVIPPANTIWAYNDATTSPGLAAGWQLPAYDTNSAPGWKSGPALFGNDSAGIYDTATQPFAGMGTGGFLTPLDRTGGRITFYLRTKFNWSGPTAGVTLVASNWVDDGQVAYLNGVEVGRIRLAAAPTPIAWDTLGANPATEGAVEVQTWDASALVQGENTLAVEVHQSGAGSSDVAFALGLYAQLPLSPTIIDCSQPTNRTIFANRPTTLSVFALGSPALSYQWYKDGSPINPAVNPSATTANYQVASMQPSDAGAYFVRLSNASGTADSRTAIVEYVNDVDPPQPVSAVGGAAFDKVVVGFNEVIDAITGADAFNYTVSDGANVLTITSVTLSPNFKRAIIALDPGTPLLENTHYTVTVSGIADPAGNILTSANVDFQSWVLGAGNGLLFESFGPESTGNNNLDQTLLVDPNFPNNPRDRLTMPVFDTLSVYPDFSHEGYGARIRGLFIPPVSGPWVFHLASDDASRLFLNPNGPSAAGKVKIAEETGCCHDWAFAPIISAPQTLQAGQGYYIEAIYKEGTGGDYCKVAARLADEPLPNDNPNGQSTVSVNALNGDMIGYPAAPAGIGGPITITAQPADANIIANQSVSFSVAASNPNGLPIRYQWRRDGVAIPGANGPTFSYGPVPVTDNNAIFDCVLAVIGTTVATAPAHLGVTQDVDAPACVAAAANLSLGSIVVRFNEFVEAASASDSFNYTVPGFTISAASVNPDGKSVTVVLDSLLTASADYSITASSIGDLSGNIMANPCTLNFRTPTVGPGFLVFQSYDTGGGNTVDLLENHPTFPNNPREVRYMSSFDTRTVYPDDSHENYGGWIFGYFTPPTSGNWIFYLRSDDSSKLYLNPTGTSVSGKVLLTEETACCTAYSAHASPPQALTAGQSYYIEALYKEGGGGDYCQVAAKLASDPTNPDTLRPISGAYLSSPADPTGATISITQQPTDQVFVITPDTLLDETFNSSDGGFTVETPIAFDGPWMYDAGSGTWHADGQQPENSHANTSFLSTPAVTVTRTGPVTLTFEHRYSFEYDGTRWDGGQVQLSVNGSPFAAVPAAAFTQNGYGGNTIASGSSATLAGQPAFTAQSTDYALGTFITTRASGTFNAGDTIRIRFAYSADTNTRGAVPNWQINHVVISMGGGAQPVAFTAAATASKTPVSYQWFRDNGSGFAPVAGANSATLSILPVCGDNGAKFQLRVYIPGASAISSTATLTVTQPNTAPLLAVTAPPAVNEDSGPQTVPGVVHDVAPGTTLSTLATPAIAINFAADEPAGLAGGILAASDKAGAIPQANWNNANLMSGSSAGLNADYAGSAVGTAASVTWSSPNTWSSTGRNEENNGFPAGPDRTMMTGYLDTGDTAANGLTITVNGLGAEFTSGGYDVLVYALGGVAGRGGAYTIGSTTKYGTSPANPATHSEDPGVDVNDTGTYVRFNGLTGSSFTLTANADASVNPPNTVNFRAPVNGIQIIAHNQQQIPIYSLNTGFDSLPAGSVSSGTTPPFVDGGHLVITRNGVTSEANYWLLPVNVPPLPVFHAQFKALLNGAGGADGFSVSLGQNIGAGFLPEDGGPSGLAVTVDTFDNGGGEVGIETRWNGARLSFTPIGGGTVHGPPELSKNQFVNATVDVTSAGLVTFNYDGFVTSGQIPNYAGISGNQLVIAGRTGGASEDAFIDDLSIAGYAPGGCGSESGQTVHFNVSNDNPSLFSAQPAIGANGTLTYTPAANASGIANVTVVAQDNGGTAFGGSDTSAPKSFVIRVNAVNDCPTASGPGSISVVSGGSVPVPLTASDLEGDALTAGVVTPPAHGTLSGSGLNVSYTAAANYEGPDSFVLAVTDGTCTSANIPVNVTVLAANHPPSCLATLQPAPCLLHFPGNPNSYVLAVDDQVGCINLDGSGSSDVDGDALTFTWNLGPFTVNMDAAQEPGGGGTGTGSGIVTISGNQVSINVTFSGLTAPATAAHFHAVAGPGTNAGVIYPLTAPNATSGTLNQTITLVEGTRGFTIAQQLAQLRAGLWYVNIHSSFRPGGEIRGQVVPPQTAQGAVVTHCFPLGCTSVELAVSDGRATTRCNVDVCVISTGDAVEQLVALIDAANIARSNKRPFIASLKAAAASFDRGSFTSGLNQLHAFQNKARAQVAKTDPAAAQAFIQAAQDIIDAVNCAGVVSAEAP